MVFVLLGLLSDACYAMAASAAGRWLRRSRAYLHFERYVGGAMLIALGITAALAGNNSKK
ncbi:hypothetical protein D3C85_1770100 [compost metagenome]